MSLNPEDIKKIAYLARLQIDEADVVGYARNLSEILALVEQMNNVATDGVRPMAHPQDISQRLRADKVTQSNQRARFQQNAPRVEAGLYLVPQVIE